jgi:hypothetical protein
MPPRHWARGAGRHGITMTSGAPHGPELAPDLRMLRMPKRKPPMKGKRKNRPAPLPGGRRRKDPPAATPSPT